MNSSKILIVDDELDQVKLLQRELQGLEFSVVGVARDAHEAIALTQKERPDLVLMDIRIPVPNGIRAAEVIWQLYVTPVLFLTAHGEREDSLRAGAFGYLSKPVQAGALRTAMEAAIYNYDTFNIRTQNYHLALFGIEPSGHLLSLSKSAEKFTGYSRDELVGHKLEELLAPEARATSRNLVKETMEERKPFGGQVVIKIKSGQKVSVEADYNPVCLNGEVEGISINAWKKATSLSDKWLDSNRRRLELIDKKHREDLNEAEERELDKLQAAADSHVESLGEVDQERLKELRVIYKDLMRKQGHERSEG